MSRSSLTLPAPAGPARRRIVPVGLAGAVLLAAGLSGCNLVGRSGEGPVTTETRQVSAFTRVESTWGIGLVIRIGAAQPLEVRAEANILPIIATDVQGGTLQIRASQEYNTLQGVDVVIVTPSLDGISMSGGSDGQISALAAERVDIEVTGGSTLTATGTATTIALLVGGSSQANLDNVAAKTITLELSGGATATVRATDQVSGSASGGAHATVLGGARLNIQSSGGAEVRNG